MTPTSSSFWPHLLGDAVSGATAPAAGEVGALHALRSAGVPVAPLVVVPAGVEERFYRLNTLPDRLLRIFADVDPEDPDEDDLEILAPEAVRLIERHFLLDELVDAFYDRIERLPHRLHVRRADRSGLHALRGRPALLALKELWAADWTFDALTERLRRNGTFAIEARDALVHGEDAPAPPDLVARAVDALGYDAHVWCTPEREIARVSVARRRGGSAESAIA